MKIKKRLKHKSCLPKADNGMDPRALSNMNKQAAEETPAQGEGLSMANAALGGINTGLGALSAFTPKDNNDGIGISHKTSNITSGITGGLDAASGIASSIPGVGQAVGAGLGIVSKFITMIKGAVDHKRENDRSITSRLARKEYDPTNNNTGYSFGNGTAKYGMPLFGDGGSIKYDSNFRPATSYEQKYNKETGLWEVGDAKPKQTTTTKKTVPQKVKPIYTSDPNDKRLQAYNDSLQLHNKAIKDWKGFAKLTNNINNPKYTTFDNSIFYEKKPVQAVIYQKPEVSVPKPKFNVTIPQEEKQSMQELLGKVLYASEPSDSSTESKGSNPKWNWVSKSPYGGDHKYDEKGRQIYALGGFINKNKINNSLSNGMFSPNGKFFSSPEQYQQYQSLYNPQFQLQQPIMNNYGTLKMKSDFKNNSFFELGGDPRAQSNIEAEGEEAMLHSNNQVENIEGPSHEEINTKLGGKGVPIKVQPSHEYIFSNSLGRDKNGNITLNEKDVVKSFADDAKSIQRRYSKREGDSIVDKTKELELAFLKQDAEQARVAKEEIEMGKQIKKYKAKYGANLKKFGTSGYVPFTNFPGSIGDEAVDPNSTLAMQQQLLQYNPNALPKYGADNKWGAETTAGFVNNPGVYNLQQSTQSSTPQPLFGGGNRINPFVGPRVPSRRDNLREAANFYTPGQVGTPRMATPSIDQRSTAPEVADKVKNGMFSSLTTGDKMQLASMLPAFGFNMGMGLRKADVEPNRKNLYEKDVVNIMQNRKFDIQNYLNQSNLATNTAKEDIGNNSTSGGGKMANLQKLYANQLGTLGDITTKGQEMNNQYRAEEANTKNILGEANRAESIRAAGINDQNKARKQQFLAKAFEQMGQGLATTGQAANQSKLNSILAKSLSEIAPDFDIKELKDVYKDKDGYIIFRGEKTDIKVDRDGRMISLGTTATDPKNSQYAPKSFSIGNFTNKNKQKGK